MIEILIPNHLKHWLFGSQLSTHSFLIIWMAHTWCMTQKTHFIWALQIHIEQSAWRPSMTWNQKLQNPSNVRHHFWFHCFTAIGANNCVVTNTWHTSQGMKPMILLVKYLCFWCNNFLVEHTKNGSTSKKWGKWHGTKCVSDLVVHELKWQNDKCCCCDCHCDCQLSLLLSLWLLCSLLCLVLWLWLMWSLLLIVTVVVVVACGHCHCCWLTIGIAFVVVVAVLVAVVITVDCCVGCGGHCCCWSIVCSSLSCCCTFNNSQFG